MEWTRISLVLCVFGFLKEFRPSEPFVTEYLTGPWKNFTAQQVYQEIYPVSTYTYFAILVAVFLVTDFLRYKPVIILCGLSGSCTYITLIFAQTIGHMTVTQVLIGTFFATEVAYFTYIYAKVSKVHYQEVTSHVRVALLLGRFTASVTSQLIVSFDQLDYHQLIYITLSALLCATIWSFFLPSVSQSVYFHRPIASTSDESLEPKNYVTTIESEPNSTQLSQSRQELQPGKCKSNPTSGVKVKTAYYLLWRDFLRAYSNSHILKWSIWWAFATCGWTQVSNFVQLLWQSSLGEEDNVYNAAVEASHTLLGALGAFSVGKLKLNWPVVGEATLSIFALIQGTLLLIASQSFNVWVGYTAYVTTGVIYQAMITVASSEVAKNLSEDSYGLIFGINTFVALLMQSLLTFLVTGSRVFALEIRPQFVVYGGYFLTLGTVFMIMAGFTITKHCKSDKHFTIWQPKEAGVSHES